MRQVYDELIQDPARIEQILLAGARKARAIATPFTARLREAVGLRRLDSAQAVVRQTKSSKASAPAFKQYRESDGLFYFKLLDAAGQLLLQSKGFASPREAGQAIARLQQLGSGALETLQPQLEPAVDSGALAQALAHFQSVEG